MYLQGDSLQTKADDQELLSFTHTHTQTHTVPLSCLAGALLLPYFLNVNCGETGMDPQPQPPEPYAFANSAVPQLHTRRFDMYSISKPPFNPFCCQPRP